MSSPPGILFVEKSKKGWFADVQSGEGSKREVLAVVPVELQDSNHDLRTEWGCYPDAESIRGLSEWLDGIGEAFASTTCNRQVSKWSWKGPLAVIFSAKKISHHVWESVRLLLSSS